MRLSNNDTIIANTTFSHCMSDGGGAIYLDSSNSNSSVTDSTFMANSAASSGGAIYFQKGNDMATITRVLFADNSAAAGLGGGGIFALSRNNDVHIRDTEFTSNRCGGGNGAAMNLDRQNTGWIVHHIEPYHTPNRIFPRHGFPNFLPTSGKCNTYTRRHFTLWRIAYVKTEFRVLFP